MKQAESQKGRDIIYLLAIFALSIFLRVYNVANRMPWWGDHARDIMVGTHISQFGELPTVGHSSIGLGGTLHYPPWYFYLVSAVTRISPDAEFIGQFFAILSATTLFGVFFIARSLFSRTTAFIAAALFSLSSSLVGKSYLWSAYVVVPFVSIGVACVLSGIHGKYFWKIVGYLLLVFSSSIHLSALFVLAFVFIIDNIFIDRRRAVITLSVVLLSVGITFYPTFVRYQPSYIFEILFESFKKPFFYELIVRMIQIGKMVFTDLFDYNARFLQIGMVAVGVAFILGLKGYRRNLCAIFCLSFFVITLFIIGSLINSGDQYVHFYIVALPVLTILLSVVVAAAIESANNIDAKVMAWITTVLLFVAMVNGFYHTLYSGSMYRHAKQVSLVIQDTAQEMGFGNAYLIAASSQSSSWSWESPTILYFLEKQGKRTTLVDYDNNLRQYKEDESTPWFVVCRDYSPELLSACIEKFTKGSGKPFHLREITVSLSEYRLFIASPNKEP